MPSPSRPDERDLASASLVRDIAAMARAADSDLEHLRGLPNR